MFRRDWIMRLIEEIGDFARKIAGHVDKGQFEQALDVANRAWSEVLDVPRELVDRIDAPALAELLREPAKQRAAAQLLVAEARAYAGKGDPLHAALCYRRAYVLTSRPERKTRPTRTPRRSSSCHATSRLARFTLAIDRRPDRL